MQYLSVCSGICAATVAWQPLGWRCAAFSEIEAFPSAVLAHHHPRTPNLGDMQTISRDSLDGPIDILVGGTPCQSFSVAGLREGMDDPRGQLALIYLRLVDDLRPRWVVWENVPGVLSSSGGRDFGAFLGALGELGYGWSYRVLDAQFFGVAQRRRRVFVVGHSGGSWQRAAAVLFERASLRGDPAPSRKAGAIVAAAVIKGAAIGRKPENGPQRGEVLTDGQCYTLNCTETHAVATIPHEAPIVFTQNQCGDVLTSTRRAPSLGTNSNATGRNTPKVMQPANGYAVRRLTPRECERLQGFPDDFTRIAWRGKPPEQCPDGPRYRAIGNAMAVPVMRWIGERINAVEATNTETK